MYKGLWIAVPFDKRPNAALGSLLTAKNYLSTSEGGEVWCGEDVLEMRDSAITHKSRAKPYTTVVPSYSLEAELLTHKRDAAIRKSMLITALAAINGVIDTHIAKRSDSIRLHLGDASNSLNEAIELIRRTYDV